MSMSEEQLGQILGEISASLNSVREELNELKHKPALNGEFTALVKQVKELHEGFHRVEEILIDPSTGEGLVMRVNELARDNEDRKDFLSNTVMPSLEQHRQMVFKMEQLTPVLAAHDKLKEDVAELKLKQSIQSKLGWALGLAMTSIIVKGIMDLLMAGTP
jgi:hypothetical protein